MALETKEKTALDASVGADAGQSIQSKSTQIITAEFPEINDQNEIFQENMDEISHRMQNIGNPNYLHTVSMSELYQTTYKSRPPIVEGLLYAGAYILAGAPKIGNMGLYHKTRSLRMVERCEKQIKECIISFLRTTLHITQQE